jgi:iron complex outermembrane recepter protein
MSFQEHTTRMSRTVDMFVGSGAIVLCAAMPASSIAQEIDEIVVTGIRGSLSASAEIKREAPVILDSITSEDLGKFPDSNVAESLQRIPGVAIDRSGGEGRFVTVRGFGPQFNTVLLNGRTFATDNVGREFSFDLLAAELIAGADVYKSATASIPDGGIGSTINVKTPRPLEIGGFKAIVSAKGVYEDLSEDIAPQPFAMISDIFADGKIGLLAAVSYQERDSLTNFTDNGGYLPNSTVGPTDAPLFTDVYAPRNQDVGQDRQHRERLGINVTGQYQPQENLTLTLDGLYNRFDVDSTIRSLGNWFEPSSYTAATIDENRTVTSLTTNGNADFIATSGNRYVTTRAAGLNADWSASDALRVEADVSWSHAKDNAGGRNYFTVIGVPSTYSFVEASGSDFPSVFGHTADLTDPTLGRTHLAARQGNDQIERVVESKLDFEWNVDGELFRTARVGLINTDRKKESVSVSSDGNANCIYCGYPTSVDPALLQPFTLDNFLSGGGSVPTQFQSYDPQAYFAFLESAEAAAALDAARDLAPGTTAAALAATSGYAATPQPSSFAVDENVYGGYIDFDFGGTFGAMPWFLNVGVRYVRTEVDASGQQLTLTDILPVPNDPTIYQAVYANSGLPESTRVKSEYDDVLPSLNFRLNFTDEVIGRFSASRTLTRPRIQDMAPRTNFDTIRPATLDASGGNPNLKPYSSINYDVSVEWYPSATTTLSAAVFYKEVEDFIVQTRENEEFTIANAGGLPVGGLITAPNTAVFSVRRPRNAETAEVDGYELNLVHSFDWLEGFFSGFGTQLNATFVDSDATFSPDSTTTSFALEGLGDSQNATVFYEQGPFAARVAYNRRERFLEFLVTPNYGGDPVFRRTFEQVDLRVSYNVTEAAQVFLEGINVFDEEIITTGRFDDQVLDYIETGARWGFGVRMSFE